MILEQAALSHDIERIFRSKKSEKYVLLSLWGAVSWVWLRAES